MAGGPAGCRSCWSLNQVGSTVHAGLRLGVVLGLVLLWLIWVVLGV
jgi:hypothetical protein